MRLISSDKKLLLGSLSLVVRLRCRTNVFGLLLFLLLSEAYLVIGHSLDFHFPLGQLLVKLHRLDLLPSQLRITAIGLFKAQLVELA